MPLRNNMIAHKEKKYFHPQKHIAHSIKNFAGLLILMQCINKLYLVSIWTWLQHTSMINACRCPRVSGYNGHKPKRPKPKRPQRERPQTGTATNRNGLWPFRFVAVSVCGRFGLWPLWPVTCPSTHRHWAPKAINSHYYDQAHKIRQAF